MSPILQRQKLRPGERASEPDLATATPWFTEALAVALPCLPIPPHPATTPPHPVPTWVRVWYTGAAQVHTATRHLLQPWHIHGREPRQRLQVPGKVIIAGGGQEPAERGGELRPAPGAPPPLQSPQKLLTSPRPLHPPIRPSLGSPLQQPDCTSSNLPFIYSLDTSYSGPTPKMINISVC